MTALELWSSFACAALQSGDDPKRAVETADEMLQRVRPRLVWCASSAQAKLHQSKVPMAVDLAVNEDRDGDVR